ncbi:MAG TPA: NUDIX domain-containing protein [Candidatus Mcinerneyibacteriales bacterium]|nr:NUDIX domain-containing protein [Candidatus Mcinerneyibacteriales bacterium]
MISFVKNNRAFNLRASALIQRGEEVLVHTLQGNDFWVLPGGRVHLGESTAEALIREIREEMGVSVRIIRPLWAVENFFIHQGTKHQNFGITYLVELEGPKARPFYELNGILERREGNETLLFRWMSPEEISSVECYPSFLKERISDLPSSFEHIIHYDEVPPEIKAKGLE